MIKRTMLFIATLAITFGAKAQNPIICDRYTPDPAPYVHGDTLYLFVDHDEDITQNGYFTMKDWLLYSTVDMVNWTYRGTPLTSATFSSWAKQDNDCWASQCIERNGKWYWYVTATIKGQAYPGIGVAVADSPAGPYHDPIGRPLVQGWFRIDPTVMIDDDGQAYLFYGNNMLWYARLSNSMTAIVGGENEVVTKDQNAFGPFKGYNDGGTPKTNSILNTLQVVYPSIGHTPRLTISLVLGPTKVGFSDKPTIVSPFTVVAWSFADTIICSTTTENCQVVAVINVPRVWRNSPQMPTELSLLFRSPRMVWLPSRL